MKNGTIKFVLKSKPNPNEYHYLLVVKSYTGKLWESFSPWVGYGDNAKEAQNEILEMMQDGKYIKQAIDNILSDNPGVDAHGNPIFCNARDSFKEKYNAQTLHPLFPNILKNFGLK